MPVRFTHSLLILFSQSDYVLKKDRKKKTIVNFMIWWQKIQKSDYFCMKIDFTSRWNIMTTHTRFQSSFKNAFFPFFLPSYFVAQFFSAKVKKKNSGKKTSIIFYSRLEKRKREEDEMCSRIFFDQDKKYFRLFFSFLCIPVLFLRIASCLLQLFVFMITCV